MYDIALLYTIHRSGNCPHHHRCFGATAARTGLEPETIYFLMIPLMISEDSCRSKIFVEAICFANVREARDVLAISYYN